MEFGLENLSLVPVLTFTKCMTGRFINLCKPQFSHLCGVNNRVNDTLTFFLHCIKCSNIEGLIIMVSLDWTKSNIYNNPRKCPCKWDCIITCKKNKKRIFQHKIVCRMSGEQNIENACARWAIVCFIYFNTLLRQVIDIQSHGYYST